MKNTKRILHSLYIELVKLQKEIIDSGLKVCVILEGRDAAGKDGMVKAITKHLSPRETRVVALSKPSDRQEHEWYFQRYSYFLPVSGQFVIFNRSWYNRLGVERVMGFCTKPQYNAFFDDVALYEKLLVDSGFIIMKYYLDISKAEQKFRLDDRRKDPLKQWKISPIDKVAQKHWGDYSKARNEMLERTNFNYAHWFVVDAEDKDKAHVALIGHLLKHIDYPNKNKELVEKDYELVYPAAVEDLKKRLY